MLHPCAGRGLLRRGLEEELVDFADGQALGQIIERAVLGAAMMTVALRFATGGKTFDDRSAEQVGRPFELPEQPAFALAQGQRGFAGEAEYPSHMYG